MKAEIVTPKKSIAEYKQYDKFLLAVDCIIFGFDGEQLKALFIKRAFEPGLGKWSLMGGFVKHEEGVEEAAQRILNQLTGLSNIYMEQLSCFGEVDRDPGGRVVSIAYFALINITDYGDELMKEHNAKWFDLKKVPNLIFDHKKMVTLAKERLQQKVANHPIGFALLPYKFTLRQLQSLYEAIYETTIDKRNFTRKILDIGILNKLDEKEKESSKKGSFYYVFDEKKYRQLDKEGMKLI
ncbi:NUDIX hydrolase [Ilyomonas limi]|uniref:NUDIX hydrolase n=1 Tax=Ilyomonas limi TaxID=2575867 RepID=A0A4U3KSX0_9BACT|nr:NUDIX hydrolase [Ilyomonas limi]TKK64789.1 NUDIX hydrolase [Ilyomonas limi]